MIVSFLVCFLISALAVSVVAAGGNSHKFAQHPSLSNMVTEKEPSKICGHVFALSCGVDGIAADSILLKNDEKDFVVKLVEPNKSDKGKGSSFRRGKPLLALDPMLFLESGDVSEKSNENAMFIMKEIFAFAYSIVDKFGVDIAICIPKEDFYFHSQDVRSSTCPFIGGPFWMLSESQKSHCLRLAKDAKIGRLTVFVGAGISIPSGAPSWGGLLEQLAIKAGMGEEDRELLMKLDYMDQPTILAEELGADFKPAIAEILKGSSRYTPAHALLKALKSPAVTTNYDDLYEQAGFSCFQNIPTLPWDSRKLIEKGHAKANSLLKLHGCINHPDRIILSRKDYMRFPDTSQALRGRLHSLFLTSEILFCGFSMTDDNVHKVIDDVRKVLYEDGKPTGHKLGTILSMTENKMFNRLWDQDFHLQAFGKSWGDNPSWFHDCFLDCMVSSSVGEK